MENPRTSTFANIGIDLSGVNNIQSALSKANLDYIVETSPVYYDINGEMHEFKEYKTPIRLTDNFSYGIVGNNYGIVQNCEAFDFVNFIDAPIEFVKGGETASGMVYVICKMDEMDILGDSFTPYVLFRNSFNGKYALSACICPLRIVCQNQFNVAFRDTSNTINLKHSKNVADKYKEAQVVLAGTVNYLARLKLEAEKYAGIKIGEADTRTIITNMFPIRDTMSDREKATITSKILAFESALRNEDNRNFRGTAWGIINAYTDFITHEESIRKTKTAEENKFISVTFDPKIMSKLLNVVNAVA